MRTLILILVLLFPVILYAETLHLVTSLDPLEAKEFKQAFEKDTGIDIQWIRLSAGETLARLKSEAKNPTQDVWFGAPAVEFISAKGDGLLVPYSSKQTETIPAKWRDKDGYWTGIYFGAIVFIGMNDSHMPSSWQELLAPEYKGEIVVSYPYTAGTGFTMLAGLVSMYGEDEALDYYKRLDGQVRRYTKSGGAPIIEVGLGEANVGIVFDQDANRKGISRGFPLKVIYPSDGVPYEIGGVALVKGGNEAIGRKFIDWIVSLPAQNLMQKWYRVPLHPQAVVNPVSKRPDELKLVNMNFEELGTRRKELIDKWREKVGK